MKTENEFDRNVDLDICINQRLTRTKSGMHFDSSSPQWKYKDGVEDVSLNFDGLAGCSPSLVAAAQSTLTWYAEYRSPSLLLNLFGRFLHFVRFTASSDKEISSITAIALCNYKAELDRNNQLWYLGQLSGFFKRWHRLGYVGIVDDAIALLRELRLPANPKGVAVLTRCPIQGPFTSLEWESLQDALNTAYANGRVSSEDFVLSWLYILLGQRNVQHAALKVCDVRVTYDAEGAPHYSVMMPRAKQRLASRRAEMKERALIEEFGRLLKSYADMVKQRFIGLLPDPDLAPLFPSHSRSNGVGDFGYHRTPDEVGFGLTATLEKLEVISERTGGKLNIFPLRFRRTIGTRAAEEGHGPLVIAELLDHTDTQNVHVYSASTPEMLERIDRATAMLMAPLAKVFAEGLEDDKDVACDPSQRIIDLRIDASGGAMGRCGKCESCDFNAPIACYTGNSFRPWLHGPHELVLRHLLDHRERLLQTSDIRIAGINDKTIFAVAAVIQACGEILAEELEAICE